METLYGNVPGSLISDNLNDLIGQVFKLLPYKESNFENLNYYFATLLFRIRGMSSLLNSSPEFITVMSLLEAARTEENFSLYRKAVLDCCSILKNLQVKYNVIS